MLKDKNLFDSSEKQKVKQSSQEIEEVSKAVPVGGSPVNPLSQAPQPVVPSAGPNANLLDLFPQGLPSVGSNARIIKKKKNIRTKNSECTRRTHQQLMIMTKLSCTSPLC